MKTLIGIVLLLAVVVGFVLTWNWLINEAERLKDEQDEKF